MRYRHKIDLWIRLTLYIVVLMYVPIFFFVPEDELWILVLTMLVTAVIVLPLMWGYIEFNDDHILIRMSIFKQKIYYENIKSVKLVSNMFSSMALTRDRVEIKEHGKGFVRGTTYIGPEDREDFYDELRRRCHKLEDGTDIDLEA